MMKDSIERAIKNLPIEVAKRILADMEKPKSRPGYVWFSWKKK